VPKEAKKKRRGLRVTLIVLGSILVLLVVGSLVALGVTEPERREGRNLPIAAVDFKAVPNGTYRGKYEGGRFGWRANEVKVTVANGKLTDIVVVESAVQPVPDAVLEPLFKHVIAAQSLQVDTISQATITSKSYLKSIEDALVSRSTF
jgi:uncharacterized protein with FMN-binding domain